MRLNFSPVDSRFWRMLGVRWQHDPLSGGGAAITGGRWNRRGQPALYLSTDHGTAVAEFHQDLIRPGTLTPYDVVSEAIVDLTDIAVRSAVAIADTDLSADWKTIVAVDRGTPPGWRHADALIGAGADGALFPSRQVAGATNLVLWRWSIDGSDGARVTAIDPHGDLRR